MNMRTLKNLIAGLPDDTEVKVDYMGDQITEQGNADNRLDSQQISGIETSVDNEGNYTLTIHGKRD